MKQFWSKWLGGMMLASCALTSQAMELESCHVDGIKEGILCGTLSVAENPEKPDGKKISLNVTVLTGHNVTPESVPLLILAGGPGQAATEMTAGLNHILKQVRQNRDIVFIDQRGTGKSNSLQCTNLEIEGLGLDIDLSQFDLAEQAKECLTLLKDSDLSQYSTNQAIDDFEAVREALGYQQFHLYGASYGTRAGLVYLRRYPQSVASAVLDSVAPTQQAVGLFGQTFTNALDLVIQNCKDNEQCHQAFPNIKQDFVEFIGKLEHGAIKTQVIDPLMGTDTPLFFDRDKMLNTIRAALYAVQTQSLLPLIITEANKGNFRPFLGLYAAQSSGMGLHLGLTLTIICSEDWPRVTPAMLAADNDNYAMGDSVSRTWVEMCKVWPKYEVAESFAEPVKSDVPTLLLSGRLDPVTPPSWGDQAAETLTQSRHMVAYNGAHSIVSHTCAPKVIARFLDEGDLQKLDDSCLTKQRKTHFMINANSTSL